MKTFTVVEISLAFLVAGFIFFYPDRATMSSADPAASKAVSHFVRHKSAMKPQQNCSLGNVTVTISSFNFTTNTTTYYNISNGAACQTVPSGFNLAAATTQTIPINPSYNTPFFTFTLGVDCSVGSSFVQAKIASILNVSPSQIIITSVSCGSLTAVFQCGSALSSQDASSVCSKVMTVCTPGSSLNNALNGLSCGSYGSNGSTSSTALYGLFALIALPVLICGCLILWYRSRQREADNQYMQDTATFSNVAASPQALGTEHYYPPPATFSNAPAGYVPAGDPYMKPY
jgi:hypothetical protein